MTSEIEDRRQQAREAFWDLFGEGQETARAGLNEVDEAIEIATQVRFTPELIRSVRGEVPGVAYGDVVNVIRRFCTVAGFEIVEIEDF